MQVADVAQYAARAFMDPEGSGLPSPEVAQGIVFTAVSFVIGWLASRGGSQRRLKARVINELILSQSELKARAYPKVWRQADVRETWMLDPFVARLRFLYASLNEAKSLSGKQLTLIDVYITRVEAFIEKWSETSNRHETYHYTYGLTYHAMRSAAKSLGLNDMSRFAGLASPKDELFSTQVAMTPQPQKPVLAPAE